MTVIYRGRRYFVANDDANGGGIPLAIDGQPLALVRMALHDRDLIVAPTAEDLHLAAALERA